MNINEIIYHLITGTASDKERMHFDAWLKESPDHQEKYEKLMENSDFWKDYQNYSQIDVDKAWDQFMEMAKRDDGEHEPVVPEKRNTLRRLLRVAAMLLLIVGLGWFLLYRENKPEPPVIPQIVSQAIAKSTESGKNAANVIIKVKGEEQINQEVTSDDLLAVLTGTKDAVCEIETHTAKEFWVTLPDGSRVHLNYNARLIYPNRFVGDTRQVYVEGEAYFYISKDSRHPFIVNTSSGMLKQYGTEFYINAPKESTMVVLIDGAVSVTPKGGTEQMMKCGQQAVFNTNGSSLKIEDVDTSLYTAWNEGRMVFEDCPLENLMEVLAKWYDFDYTITDDKLRKVHLSGTFDRYGSLDGILNVISDLTNAETSLRGNKVVLGRKGKR